MDTPINTSDPRVKRTHQLLLQAFRALLDEKHNIHSISVQEIAERATLNRATFYAHFEDKYALLESWIREKFQQTLQSQLPATAVLELNTLYTLILVVFEFLANMRRYLKPADKQFEPLFEIALQKELHEILLKWLNQSSTSTPVEQETREITALVISWAIFGSAVQWSREDQTRSAQEMAKQVLTIVVASMSPLAANLSYLNFVQKSG